MQEASLFNVLIMCSEHTERGLETGELKLYEIPACQARKPPEI